MQCLCISLCRLPCRCGKQKRAVTSYNLIYICFNFKSLCLGCNSIQFNGQFVGWTRIMVSSPELSFTVLLQQHYYSKEQTAIQINLVNDRPFIRFTLLKLFYCIMKTSLSSKVTWSTKCGSIWTLRWVQRLQRFTLTGGHSLRRIPISRLLKCAPTKNRKESGATQED